MSDRQASRRTRRRETVLWAIPIVAGLLGVLIGFAIATAQPERFEHVVTLVSANDGRIGVRDNRDLAQEILAAEVNANPPASGIDVELDSRLGSVLDIIVVGDTEAEAAAVAEDLASLAVEQHYAASQERFTTVIGFNEAAIADLDVRIAASEATIDALNEGDFTGRDRLERDRGALADSRNELRRQIVSAEAQLEAATAPVRQLSSIARCNTSQARQVAGLVGAAAAMMALIIVSAVSSRGPDR